MENSVIKCPWCGRELKSRRSASHHFRYSHNKSVTDYFIEVYGIDYVTCKYPGCNNLVGFQGGWTPNKTCSHSHQLALLGLEGVHWYQRNNREKDTDGNDIIMKGVTERGNNPFSGKNRKYDENGNDIIANRSMKSKLLSGIINPITFKSGSRDLKSDIESNIYILVPKFLNYIKVGRSVNLESRIFALSKYVDIDYCMLSKTDEITAANIEAEVHKKFCKNICLDKSIINYSEWYDKDCLKEIIEFIETFNIAVQRLE